MPIFGHYPLKSHHFMQMRLTLRNTEIFIRDATDDVFTNVYLFDMIKNERKV